MSFHGFIWAIFGPNRDYLAKHCKFLQSLQNDQFLFLSQNWLILTVKKRNIWIFAPKLVQNCHFMVLLGAILGQNGDFWPKNSNIWYILESKIQEYYWILAQKIILTLCITFECGLYSSAADLFNDLDLDHGSWSRSRSFAPWTRSFFSEVIWKGADLDPFFEGDLKRILI